MTSLSSAGYWPLFTPTNYDKVKIAICAAGLHEFSQVDEVTFRQKMHDPSKVQLLSFAVRSLFDYVHQIGFLNFLSSGENDRIRKTFLSELKVISGRLSAPSAQTFVRGLQMNEYICSIKRHLKHPGSHEATPSSSHGFGVIRVLTNIQV